MFSQVRAAKMKTFGSFLCVHDFDYVVLFSGYWSKGDNPKTANRFWRT